MERKHRAKKYELKPFFITTVKLTATNLTNELLLDDLEQLVLLEGLTGHVEGQIITVNNTTKEAEVLGHKVFNLI